MREAETGNAAAPSLSVNAVPSKNVLTLTSEVMGAPRGDQAEPSFAEAGQRRKKPARCSQRSAAGSPSGFDTADLKDAKALLEELS
jgi:hypothetical protein